MKRVSIKNLSLLGLVLMAASAVTAAVLPDKSNGKRAHSGSLRVNSGAGGSEPNPVTYSCVADDPDDTVFTCTLTAASQSTGTGGTLVVINDRNYQTIGNTSVGAGANSVLQLVP